MSTTHTNQHKHVHEVDLVVVVRRYVYVTHHQHFVAPVDAKARRQSQAGVGKQPRRRRGGTRAGATRQARTHTGASNHREAQTGRHMCRQGTQARSAGKQASRQPGVQACKRDARRQRAQGSRVWKIDGRRRADMRVGTSARRRRLSRLWATRRAARIMRTEFATCQ